jgi:predicted nucleic-acid-binding Zn-ribbon protein
VKFISTRCKKCGGSLYLDNDNNRDYYVSCLQCAYTIELKKAPTLAYVPDSQLRPAVNQTDIRDRRIQGLYDSGWEPAKIGREFKLKASTIKTIIYKEKARAK